MFDREFKRSALGAMAIATGMATLEGVAEVLDAAWGPAIGATFRTVFFLLTVGYVVLVNRSWLLPNLLLGGLVICVIWQPILATLAMQQNSPVAPIWAYTICQFGVIGALGFAMLVVTYRKLSTGIHG